MSIEQADEPTKDIGKEAAGKEITIVLDAGHGTWNISPERGVSYDSFDVGAKITGKDVSAYGVKYEYQATDLLTASLIEAFKKYPGVEIKLTRGIDKESEKERWKKENARTRFHSRRNIPGDLFVSLHYNSLPKGHKAYNTANGPRIYVHGETRYNKVRDANSPSKRWARELQNAVGVDSVQEHRLDVIHPKRQPKGRKASIYLEPGFLKNANRKTTKIGA